MTISEIAKKWAADYNGGSGLYLNIGQYEHLEKTIQSAINEAMAAYRENLRIDSLRLETYPTTTNRPNNSQGGTTEVQPNTCNLKEDDSDVN